MNCREVLTLRKNRKKQKFPGKMVVMKNARSECQHKIARVTLIIR